MIGYKSYDGASLYPSDFDLDYVGTVYHSYDLLGRSMLEYIIFNDREFLPVVDYIVNYRKRLFWLGEI